MIQSAHNCIAFTLQCFVNHVKINLTCFKLLTTDELKKKTIRDNAIFELLEMTTELMCQPYNDSVLYYLQIKLSTNKVKCQ